MGNALPRGKAIGAGWWPAWLGGAAMATTMWASVIDGIFYPLSDISTLVEVVYIKAGVCILNMV